MGRCGPNSAGAAWSDGIDATRYKPTSPASAAAPALAPAVGDVITDIHQYKQTHAWKHRPSAVITEIRSATMSPLFAFDRRAYNARRVVINNTTLCHARVAREASHNPSLTETKSSRLDVTQSSQLRCANETVAVQLFATI